MKCNSPLYDKTIIQVQSDRCKKKTSYGYLKTYTFLYMQWLQRERVHHLVQLVQHLSTHLDPDKTPSFPYLRQNFQSPFWKINCWPCRFPAHPRLMLAPRLGCRDRRQAPQQPRQTPWLLCIIFTMFSTLYSVVIRTEYFHRQIEHRITEIMW